MDPWHGVYCKLSFFRTVFKDVVFSVSAVLFEDAVILGIGNEDVEECLTPSPLFGATMPFPYFNLERMVCCIFSFDDFLDIFFSISIPVPYFNSTTWFRVAKVLDGRWLRICQRNCNF